MSRIKEKIADRLKDGPEQQLVVGPIVDRLLELGWSLDQILFGKHEWKIPKNPSEASKRERNQGFDFFPVDIAVFEEPRFCGDYRHLLFIIECKQPDISVGLQQLETYISLEPHVQLGIWANNPAVSSEVLFVYKDTKGLHFPKKRRGADIPSVGTPLSPNSIKLTFADLVIPSPDVLYKTFSELLDLVVSRDGNVTRREEQLDQLCNLLLLKLDSDKQGKIDNSQEVPFRLCATSTATAKYIRERFNNFQEVYPDIFVTQSDKEIRFDDGTIFSCVEILSTLNFIDIGVDSVAFAFQVLRSAALKQEEGQYFTPRPVIEAAVKLMDISLEDIIIDPACGTGGFLVQCLVELKERFPNKDKEVSRWAQLHLYGIDKDAIGVKLTKAIMQILDDGSAHCVRGDSVLTHTWTTNYQHLLTNQFNNNRFTKVFTNPPFGAPLKIKKSDCLKSGLSIVNYMDKKGNDLELGLAMFNRCCDLLKPSGRMCIVLPETYFFSPSYKFVRNWVKDNLTPIGVINVPMEAFQGFCRAKTNLYIFEKINPQKRSNDQDEVFFMNPRTCGIYKNGSVKYKVDTTGSRTTTVDNELLDSATKISNGHLPLSYVRIPISETIRRDVLVPQYYDPQYLRPFEFLTKQRGLHTITLGELCDEGTLTIRGGHGSPSNDLRNGTVPYIKVSDIRNMRININPTNLVPLELAQKFWKTKNRKSNLQAWDLISPNRASSNIGEFAILLPGEEQVVLTKEMFVLRLTNALTLYDPFYLLWALSLREVRQQWQRIALMQTNREDVGMRYREISIPKPQEKEWAIQVSKPFRDYFTGLAKAKSDFALEISKDDYEYIASVSSFTIDENSIDE